MDSCIMYLLISTFVLTSLNLHVYMHVCLSSSVIVSVTTQSVCLSVCPRVSFIHEFFLPLAINSPTPSCSSPEREFYRLY